MHIRKIQPADNAQMAKVLRTVLTEFNADPKTTALGDPSVDFMYECYQQERAVYYVVEENDVIYGGGGIRQLDGSAENICELQKMYFLPELRGKGFGRKLILQCIEDAQNFGYKKIYLETLSHMHDAQALYKKNNFQLLEKPLGDTGHGGCNVFMILNL
jgi:putative acetyltransferase